MKAEPHASSPEPDDQAYPDAGLFALLNEHWEALQRGSATDLEDWATTHPEHRDKLPHLRLVIRLHDALQVLREDSSLDASSPESHSATSGRGERQFLEPGTLIDQCRIESLLGHGGMGEVYLAEHTVMGKKVAIKVLPASQVGDADAVRRFQQEVRVQARMNPHPNVAAAFHASEYQGRCYLVMEYVPGRDLREHVRGHGPLPWEQACALVRQIAVGLEYVHGHQIVHRDLKPSNLMLSPDGTVKILDLGLARHRPAELLFADGSLTPDGAVLGSLDYMAPEQARSAAKADARSDLYSLGCTFYYLLTGKAPFADRVGLEKITAHARDIPSPVRQQRPDLPEAVAAVVEKLLAKKPEERYPSAHALIEALNGAMNPASTRGQQLLEPIQGTATKGRGKRTLAFALATLGTAAFFFLALGVALLWPKPAEHATLPGQEPTAEVPPGDALRIVSLEIIHFRGQPAVRIGTIGGTVTDSFAVQEDDYVRVKAQLSATAFCYLIAFNPDGKDQLCHPADKTALPTPSGAIDYPADPEQGFPLTEGVGVQAFVLLAARHPLPPYGEWRDRVGAMPWQSIQGRGVWRLDGQRYEVLGSDRGEPRKMAELPQAFADLYRFLQERAGVDAIQALAFLVQPKDQGKAASRESK